MNKIVKLIVCEILNLLNKGILSSSFSIWYVDVVSKIINAKKEIINNLVTYNKASNDLLKFILIGLKSKPIIKIIIIPKIGMYDNFFKLENFILEIINKIQLAKVGFIKSEEQNSKKIR